MRKLKKYKPTRFKAKTSTYNKELADYAVAFIESLCHTKGTWTGPSGAGTMPMRVSITPGGCCLYKKRPCSKLGRGDFIHLISFWAQRIFLKPFPFLLLNVAGFLGMDCGFHFRFG